MQTRIMISSLDQYDVITSQYDIITSQYDIITSQYDIITCQYDVIEASLMSLIFWPPSEKWSGEQS